MSSNDNRRQPHQQPRRRFFWIPFGDGVPAESDTTDALPSMPRPRAEIVAPNLPGLIAESVLPEPSAAVSQAMRELEYQRQQASPLPVANEEEPVPEQPAPPPVAKAEPRSEQPTPPPVVEKKPLPVKPTRVKRNIDFPEGMGGDAGRS